ncbi:CRISPR-associated protein Cas5 [Sphingobium sp. SYK-6]|uniref:type I-C CRISPR-associated protein Cas5c n=1 Tax=Sphingobium sp. (strain NBRC 103272 / SYK-6) TaxID=627192 RepID=UPI00022771A8|nr:type I-C CRISPR-associated protein Cas5c [Sphingobium sp. SYK-6]BAK66414.1 CRISPR-associated protein Cas5 [Sphingobium sp. SYK-6]
MAVRLHIWGDHACFTRPEMKVERVSYDVITPSAARGILEAIHWKPAIRWHVTRIHVLNPIRFQSIRRNEGGAKASAANAASAMKRGTTDGLGIAVDENRQQRAALVLVDVAYVIEAHFTMTDRAGPDDSAAKHIAMFNRRATQGQCFHRPCLGTREFPAEFALIADGAPLPESRLIERDRDFGWMLHDIDFARGNESRFFRAQMQGGVVDVPPFDAEEVVR